MALFRVFSNLKWVTGFSRRHDKSDENLMLAWFPGGVKHLHASYFILSKELKKSDSKKLETYFAGSLQCIPSASLFSSLTFFLYSRKGKEVPPSFKHFFSSAMSLSSINVSGTKLPPEALKWELKSFSNSLFSFLMSLSCSSLSLSHFVDCSSCSSASSLFSFAVPPKNYHH